MVFLKLFTGIGRMGEPAAIPCDPITASLGAMGIGEVITGAAAAGGTAAAAGGTAAAAAGGSTLLGALGTASSLASAGSGILSGVGALTGAKAQVDGSKEAAQGAILQGQSEQASRDFRAAQETQAAGEARASSQREAFDQALKTNYQESSLQAGAAANGGTSTDAGALALDQDIAGHGEYNALSAMYRGENQARGLQDAATGDIMSGNAAMQGAVLKAKALKTTGSANATSTLLSGAGSMLDRFSKVKLT